MVQIAGQQKSNKVKQLVSVDDDGNLIISSSNKINIDTVDIVTTVGEVSLVTSVTTVDEVTNVTSVDTVDDVTTVAEVEKAVLYGTDLQAVERALQCNDEGVLSTARLQIGDVIDSGYVSFPATAPQYSQRFVDISEPTDETYDKYMLYIVNATADDIVVQVLNEFTSGLGITEYALVGDEIAVDAANITSPSAVAWSSCFTSINAALTDESGDWNDDVPPGGADVPFAFAATNDAIYFGHSAPFKVIYASVITAGSYVATFIWEYWDGDSWETLDVDATSGTGEEPFKSTGVTLYYWATPQDWVAYDIAGDPTSQYWIRARCTAYTSRAVTPILGQGAYLLSKDYDAQMHIIEGMFNGGNARIKFYMPNVGTSPAINYYSYSLKKY